MTFSATLAYGHDLAQDPRFTGGSAPAWWNPELDVYENLAARLAAEADPAGTDCGNDHSEELDDTVGGVFLTSYGSAGGPRYLLAVRGYLASDWEATVVPALDVPPCADEHLAWAVQTLGLDLADDQPRWHLAAEYF